MTLSTAQRLCCQAGLEQVQENPFSSMLKRLTRLPDSGATLIRLMSPRFLIYVSCASSIWVACYAVVTALAALTNLASTALTITIQRDWMGRMPRPGGWTRSSGDLLPCLWARVYHLVPRLAVKSQQHVAGHFLERQLEEVNVEDAPGNSEK
ncbi:uncharacterized protein AAES06_001830 [Glossophaga mutica]